VIAFAGIAVGILLLVAGGAGLVHGASQLASRLGVSPVVVGLTVVAFGTSMPELIVNILGAFRGETGLAFGNIVGSNIANLALVLGITALVRPLTLHGDLVQREVPLLLLGTTVLVVLALDGYFEGDVALISRADSIVLLLIFSVFIYITVLDVLRVRRKDTIVSEIESNPLVVTRQVTRNQAPYMLAGIALLYGGGELTISSSVSVAEQFGIPATAVGLYIVAIGTSMPELVSSVIAAARKESDLAVGNLIGSNIFNALLVLPATGLVSAIEIPTRGVRDLAFSWLLAVVLVPVFIFGNARLGRLTASFVLLAYLVWAVFRAV
jgi:cation:H+ antiporter